MKYFALDIENTPLAQKVRKWYPLSLTHKPSYRGDFVSNFVIIPLNSPLSSARMSGDRGVQACVIHLFDLRALLVHYLLACGDGEGCGGESKSTGFEVG